MEQLLIFLFKPIAWAISTLLSWQLDRSAKRMIDTPHPMFDDADVELDSFSTQIETESSISEYRRRGGWSYTA